MGQGYSMTTLSAASATIDVPELADLVYDKTLASARFMKSVRARSERGFVFVKAVMKPYPTFDVSGYVKQITKERNTLTQIPNAIGYQRIVEVGSGGFLVRQYIYSSVYDRLSTRPFLEDIEKKWLAYQLLCALRDCHAQEVYHGDIKTENLLVTSWNWLYLTDFSSSFKPTTLPEDNPADFAFYFDTSGRRTCYIAPERFTASADDGSDDELNWAMDMFSAGCVIAEIFLEEPIFSLSQIFRYKAGDYSPDITLLSRLEDADLRAMILNMIDLVPEKRYNAEQHLSFYKHKIFPDYFDSFLHQYILDLTLPSKSQQPNGLEVGTLADSDDKIDRVYQDLDKISSLLGHVQPTNQTDGSKTSGNPRPSQRHAKSQIQAIDQYDGTLLFLTVISSSLRNCTKAASRLKACELLVSFARRLPDEALLDRIVPYIVIMLNDTSDTVQATAIRALTDVFEMVQTVSPINAFIIPEYVFPRLKPFVQPPPNAASPLVRAAYASCLASLALTSNRLLDIVQAMMGDDRLSTLSNNDWAPAASFHALYGPSKEELIKHFEEATVALMTDEDVSVKRALLASVSRLCVFFGSPKSSEVILTHLNTYLNEKDWMLRCSFFDALVGVASYVGTSSLEKFILPIMVGSLTDPEGFVVETVFRSFARMADLGLLQRSTTWELVGMAARFVIHPSIWIRESAVQFIVNCAKYASKADKYCIMAPIIQPFLKTPLLDVTEEQILDHLKRPLPRSVYNSAMHWASQRPRSVFWTAASRDGSFMLSDPESGQNIPPRRILTRIPPSQKDRDDQGSLETLRNLGMHPEDELKLLALREYILKIAADKPGDEGGKRQMMLNKIMPLHQIHVTPQNVLFDFQESVREIKSRPRIRPSSAAKVERHSLADALLDASTTAAGSPSRRSTVNPAEPIDIRGRTDSVQSDVTSLRMAAQDTGPSSLASRDLSVHGRSSPGELDRLSLRKGKLELRHRKSAMSLLGRTDTGKAGPEISTTTDIAFGRLDAALNHHSTTGPSALSLTADAAAKSRSRSPIFREVKPPVYVPSHSYTGNDANVLRLLNTHFAENYPIDEYDFGRARLSVDPTLPIRSAADAAVVPSNGSNRERTNYKEWRPLGQLLAQFAEHTGAINRVCVAPDHAFFVTASDDGTCKVWDTLRLEKNFAPRSRQTHRHAPGTKVKALCFVENTHTFISGADDGSIHAVRVEYKSVDGSADTKYGKPTLVRDYTIPDTSASWSNSTHPEHAVHVHHYRTATSQSILIVATSASRILLIDLKNMSIVHSLSSPPHHGSITTFVVDKKQQWLLVGTSQGILSLWDLRFKLHLRSFGIQSSARIDALCIDPFKGHGKWIMASSAGEISVWDIERMVCREVLRPDTFKIPGGVDKLYEGWNPDDESPEKLIARFANDVISDPNILEPNLRPQLQPGDEIVSTLSTPALFPLTSYTSTGNKHPILITGSSDLHLRYWDLSYPEQSFVISGPSIMSEESSRPWQPKYVVSHPLTLNLGGQVQLVQETPASSTVTSDTSIAKGSTPKSTPTKPRRAAAPSSSGKTVKSPSAADKPASARSSSHSAKANSSSNKPMRNTIISNVTAQLLKTHMDGITDVVVLRRPYGCVEIIEY
ncbi:hypothetical protein DV737_g5175, partial [Chaetothyriales sp. CBS 132003]